MIKPIYTAPVYTRALTMAATRHQDWSESTLPGPRTWADNVLPRVNLGRASGKTSAAVAWAESNGDTVIVTNTMDQASRIASRYPGVRALSVAELDQKPPGQFKSTQPLFIFDDVPKATTLDILVKFRPTRFIHFGLAG